MLSIQITAKPSGPYEIDGEGDIPGETEILQGGRYGF